MTKALVLFHSQIHGNTAALAQAVVQGLKEAGCSVDVHNTNEGRYDIDRFPQYDCVAIGSPDYFSYVAGGVKMFITGQNHRPCRWWGVGARPHTINESTMLMS